MVVPGISAYSAKSAGHSIGPGATTQHGSLEKLLHKKSNLSFLTKLAHSDGGFLIFGEVDEDNGQLTSAVVNLVARGKKVRGQRNGVARNGKVKNKVKIRVDFPLFRGIQ